MPSRKSAGSADELVDVLPGDGPLAEQGRVVAEARDGEAALVRPPGASDRDRVADGDVLVLGHGRVDEDAVVGCRSANEPDAMSTEKMSPKVLGVDAADEGAGLAAVGQLELGRRRTPMAVTVSTPSTAASSSASCGRHAAEAELVDGQDDVVALEAGADGCVDRLLGRCWRTRVMNATRATPMMSAEAVEAVRRGLRMAFCRARRPVMPLMRGSGLPTTRASGRGDDRPEDQHRHA